MKRPPQEPSQDDAMPPPNQARLKETMRMIEDYADDLRAIIKKLRRKLN